MAKNLDISLPTTNAIIKTAIAMAIVLLAVRMTPDSWGIKRWFMAA